MTIGNLMKGSKFLCETSLVSTLVGLHAQLAFMHGSYPDGITLVVAKTAQKSIAQCPDFWLKFDSIVINEKSSDELKSST